MRKNSRDLLPLTGKNDQTIGVQFLIEERELPYSRDTWMYQLFTADVDEHLHEKTEEQLTLTQGKLLIYINGKPEITLENKGDSVIIPAGIKHRYQLLTEEVEVISRKPTNQEGDIQFS